MAVVVLEYLEIDEHGVAKLIGTRTKVRQVVMDVQSGMSPGQIHEQYPHLSMAQIHAALAYYYDHQAALDEEIAASARFAEDMRARHPNRLTRAELDARLSAKLGTEPPPAPGVGE